MAEETPAEKPEQWNSVGEQIATGILNALFKSQAGKAVLSNATDAIGAALGIAFAATSPIGVGLAKAVANAEDLVAPALSEIAAAAASDMFGTEIPSSAFASKRDHGGRTKAGDAIGAGLIAAIKGAGGPLEPSDEAAKRYLTMIVTMALEGWYQGWFFELMTSLVPQLDIGKIETFADLDDTLSQALGLGRLSRRVLSPLVDVTVVTPLEWQINKTYRPKLLGVADAMRMFTAGHWTGEQLHEELARQGYSEDRILALMQGTAKEFGASELDLLVRAGLFTQTDAELQLRYQGWDPTLAKTRLQLEKLQRIAGFERQLAAAAIDAYADGRITRSDLIGWLDGVTIDSQEQAQLAELADAKSALRVKPLTSGEVRTLVKTGILASIDYRRALQREGRDAEAVNALDLLLKHELDEKRAIDELRAEQDKERAAEQAARDAERAKARAAADAARQLARRGREADLERAVVRGRIPIARYVEVISQQFDADTVNIMVADVEDARERFLADDRRRQDAEARAARKQLDVGAVRQAVLAGVLTLDEFRRHPAVQQLDAGDVEILVRTLDAELHDRAVALQRKEEAAAKSKARGIDLGRYAQLVRRGIRTIDDYRARVAELFDSPADVDAVVELLEQDLAADAAERDARTQGETATRAKGLSLDQLRRAVLAGDAPIAAFESFLIEQQFTVDAQRILMAGLERELAEVEAARAKQQQTESPVEPLELPLSELQRAARLGVLSPSDYRARLVERGFDELDAEVSVDMLLREITSTQSARALRDQVELEPKGVELSLGELARAVKAGIKSIEDYRAALYAAGKSVDAVDTLVALLEDEVAERQAAESRRRRIADRLAKDGLDLDALERDVIAGGVSVDEYSATLAGAGVQPAEIGILVGLLVAQRAAA